MSLVTQFTNLANDFQAKANDMSLPVEYRQSMQVNADVYKNLAQEQSVLAGQETPTFAEQIAVGPELSTGAQSTIQAYQGLIDAAKQSGNFNQANIYQQEIERIYAQSGMQSPSVMQALQNVSPFLASTGYAPSASEQGLTTSQITNLAADAIRENGNTKANQIVNALGSGEITQDQYASLMADIERQTTDAYATLNQTAATNDPTNLLAFVDSIRADISTPVSLPSPVAPTTPATTTPVTPPITAPVTAPVTSPVTPPVGTAMVTPPVTTPGASPVTAGTPLSTATTNFLSNIPQLAQAPTVSPLISNLPELRGGGGGTSAIDPTLRPYLETGLQAAEQLYLRQTPQLYPGQMYVSPSQQTLDALAQQEQIARTPPSALQAAEESYMQGLGGLSATAGGAFLMGNPYLQSAIAASTRPIERQFAETTLPGIASGFSRAGRYGSEAMARSVGQATEATGRALGDVAANLAYTGYEAERGRQQQALGGQISAAQVAPQIYGQQFLPSQQLAQVGAAQETLAGQPLQEAMQRFQYSQQIPYQQLSGFLSSVYGTPMASSQYQPAAETSKLGTVLGSTALGAGIGNLIGGSYGGYSSTAIGAGLGGLAGLLF